MSEREEKFDKMLRAIQKEYETVCGRMELLKAESKTKTVTYRQLTSRKLTLQNMLSMYRIYGLLDYETGTDVYVTELEKENGEYI